jgi:hypothetical protein
MLTKIWVVKPSRSARFPQPQSTVSRSGSHRNLSRDLRSQFSRALMRTCDDASPLVSFAIGQVTSGTRAMNLCSFIALAHKATAAIITAG